MWWNRIDDDIEELHTSREVSLNTKAYSLLFKPLIIYYSKKKNSAHYICVCFWSCTERSNFLCVSSKGYTRAREALPDFPAEELLSRIAKKICTMRVPTKLTRVFPEAIHKLLICPGLFWCWLYGTGSDWWLLVYFIFIEGKCNCEELTLGNQICLFELDDPLPSSGGTKQSLFGWISTKDIRKKHHWDKNLVGK